MASGAVTRRHLNLLAQKGPNSCYAEVEASVFAMLSKGLKTLFADSILPEQNRFPGQGISSGLQTDEVNA